MEVRILGPLEVVQGGAPIDLGRPQRRALMSVLSVDELLARQLSLEIKQHTHP